MSSAAIELASEFARDVHAGLSRPGQKTLYPKYLYDDIGSVLFEAITLLPEYGLTRAEDRILESSATELAERMPADRVAELGSGSGRKTRRIVEELAQRKRQVAYYPIDVSAAALEMCRQGLAEVSGLDVRPIEAAYLDGLRRALAGRSGKDHERALVLFLGSSIGNLERAAADRFLERVRGMLAPGDGFLLGTDLIKSEEQLRAAYDDPVGVTAAFNLNMLGRINRELGGDFNIREFQHEAHFNARERRMEMYLRAKSPQTVSIEECGLTVEFDEGDTIWTECSHKYSEEDLTAMAEWAGFQPERVWIDEEWPYALSLWRV